MRAADNCDSHFFFFSLAAFSFAFAVAGFRCVRTISYRLLWHRKLWILNFSKWFHFFAHWVGHRLNSSSHRRQFHICREEKEKNEKRRMWVMSRWRVIIIADDLQRWCLMTCKLWCRKNVHDRIYGFNKNWQYWATHILNLRCIRRKH